jgi:hypothetical protein
MDEKTALLAPRVLVLSNIMSVVLEFIRDSRLRIQISRVCCDWYKFARKAHKQRISKLSPWQRQVMPSVLDELRAYFATIRKRETGDHVREENIYSDDEETDCRWLSPMAYRLLPSQFALSKYRCYQFDYRADAYYRLLRAPERLRFQDPCPPVLGRVYSIGQRMKGPYRNVCIQITLSVMGDWPPPAYTATYDDPDEEKKD